jgi:hypothetical protein
VWSPRTAKEVLWTMQSYFPDRPVTSTSYAGQPQIASPRQSPSCWQVTAPPD